MTADRLNGHSEYRWIEENWDQLAQKILLEANRDDFVIFSLPVCLI